MGASLAGSRNGRWKGGRITTPHGYRMVKRPGHPRADSRGYVYEHHLATGAPAKRGVIVHHKNGNRADNSRGNLAVMRRGKHTPQHPPGSRDRRYPAFGGKHKSGGSSSSGRRGMLEGLARRRLAARRRR